jgi:hypothetical protein
MARVGKWCLWKAWCSIGIDKWKYIILFFSVGVGSASDCKTFIWRCYFSNNQIVKLKLSLIYIHTWCLYILNAQVIASKSLKQDKSFWISTISHLIVTVLCPYNFKKIYILDKSQTVFGHCRFQWKVPHHLHWW